MAVNEGQIMIRVGLLGAGRIGKVHAKNIQSHPDSTLTAVADVHAPSATELAAKYAAKVNSLDAILNDPDIDAVLIATSTDTHSDLIERACAAGKAVLCEKPVDLSLERALACHDAVEGAKAAVMIGFNRRFDPNFATLKSAFVRGEIGKGELLSITSFDPAPPPLSYVKVSGGIFRDMMIHDFDLACWIFEGAPTRVMAVGNALVDAEIGQAGDVDTAAVTLEWDDGRIAVIQNSRRAAYGYDQRMELLGSDGLLRLNNVLENTLEISTAVGTVTAKPEHFFLERYRKAYEIEWASFVDCVVSGQKPPVTLGDGVAALACAEAATRSLRSGETVTITTDMLRG